MAALSNSIHSCDPDDEVARQVEDAVMADRTFFEENPRRRFRVPFISTRHIHDKKDQARAIWEAAASQRWKELAAAAKERGTT
jgi:hypothetical protein